MNKARKKKLHQIYASIPKIECQGKCTAYCGALGFEKGEMEEMTKAANGVAPCVDKNLTCNYLVLGRCAIYNDRPTICRIWGLTSKLGCPHGCKRERALSVREVLDITAKVKKIAGDGRIYKNVDEEKWEMDLVKVR